MRVVLDTNVLIAALVARGLCSDLFEHCVQQHQIVGSEHILTEFRDKLERKFRYSPEETQAAVDLMRLYMETVVPLGLGAAVCRDPDDDAILGTALAGYALCIVTGDEDLLVLRRFRGVAIIRPAEFAEFEAGVA